MPRKSQRERSEASISQILEGALGLFSSQGFGATSMRQIAAASDVSIGNVYHHFSSKEEIFQELIEEYWERVLDPELRLNRIFSRA
ncbi:MAG: helix-turn-helix domain-containing protein, partial [Thermoanaerobaculia bacterium]|nr:helix-turn-helix domain-containing protein [Thermoanaerobaculia bacterium]